MAITNLVPVFDRLARPNLRVITGNISAEKIHPKRLLILIVSVFMACFIIQTVISLLVTSDAFTLQDLKRQRNLVQDQRDALLIQVNQKSSPDALAISAAKLGMKPVGTIAYVDLSK
jgi:hypothetical protein